MSLVDVAVVGGGPAGSVLARALARDGLRVLLVDRGVHPRAKVCGCCLAGPGIDALAREGLGDLPDRLGATRPDHLRIRGWGRSVDVRLGGTRVVSRNALDAALLSKARGAGVEVVEGTVARVGAIESDARVVELGSGPGALRRCARVVVGAGGLAPLAFLDPAEAPRVDVRPGSRIGVGARFDRGAFPSAMVEPGAVGMYLADSGYLGLSLLEDGTIDAAGALDPEAIRRAGSIDAAVRELLTRAGGRPTNGAPTDPWRGTPPLTRRAVPAGADRVLLVGDAAGYTEPFTGEGMRWAIESARAAAPLVRAIVETGWTHAHLRDWTRHCRRERRRAGRLARVVAGLTRRPTLAAAAISLLSRRPEWAAPIVRRTSGTPTHAPSTGVPS